MDDRNEHLQSAIDCGRAWFEGEELYHHGIKNMKWGRRRYQNPDGSLTALGRVRYGVGKAGKAIGGAVKAGAGKVGAKIAAKREEKRITALMKKPIRKLTESELKERTDRANKEANLKQTEDRNKHAAMSFLGKFGDKMLNDAVIPAATEVGKNFFKKALTDALGIDSDNTFEAFKKAGFDIKKLTDKQIEVLEKRTKSEKTIYETSSNVERQKKNRGIKGDDKLDSRDDDDRSNNSNKPNGDSNSNNNNKPNGDSNSNNNNKPNGNSNSNNNNKPNGNSNSGNNNTKSKVNDYEPVDRYNNHKKPESGPLGVRGATVGNTRNTKGSPVETETRSDKSPKVEYTSMDKNQIPSYLKKGLDDLKNKTLSEAEKKKKKR